MGVNQWKNFFIWRHFWHDRAGTVIVLPSPHGDYKSGISYSDACAMGEIYAGFGDVKNLDVRAPGLAGSEISKNLILIAGQKANPIAKEFQSSRDAVLTFYLEDGVILDKENQVVVTAKYLKGEPRSIHNVTVDYGLIVYTNNPFGRSTKVLHLAGIKGFGTLAAAIAVTEESYIRKIEKFIAQHIKAGDASGLDIKTVEILVKILVADGRPKRDSLSIEKIRIGSGRSSRKWESEEYRQLEKVIPHRLHIDVLKEANLGTSITKVRLDDQEIEFAKSPDRLKMIYTLAEQAREDYLTESENEGWLNAVELSERVWQIKRRKGVTEIPTEVRKEVSNVIMTWARHLKSQGQLNLAENIKLDHDYISSEILVFDLDLKKKISDLVYLINHDGKNKIGPGFQFIESHPGLGYRINLHPALIFLTKTGQGPVCPFQNVQPDAIKACPIFEQQFSTPGGTISPISLSPLISRSNAKNAKVT